MRNSRFTEEQIIAVLREQEAGTARADVCQRHGISSATFYKWKAKFGGMDVSDAKRLRSLEDETAKLKKLLAEAMLGKRDPEGRQLPKVVTPAAERQAVAHACIEHDVSERRACQALSVDRSTVRYRGRRPDDGAVRLRIREPEQNAEVGREMETTGTTARCGATSSTLRETTSLQASTGRTRLWEKDSPWYQ